MMSQQQPGMQQRKPPHGMQPHMQQGGQYPGNGPMNGSNAPPYQQRK